MTKIVFWNLQRLGAKTDETRRKALTTLAAEWRNPDIKLYCELSTVCTFPLAQNLTYRKESGNQLCYGALSARNEDVPLTKYTPELVDGYKDAGFKGGNDFTQLADRALAYCGKIGGAKVYVIHAPASTGIKTMAFIAASMNNQFGNKTAWLVVGDFNVTPDDLGTVNVGITVSDLIRKSGVGTKYYEPSKKWSEYDYALANFPVKVSAMRWERWRNYSDHGPILLEYEAV